MSLCGGLYDKVHFRPYGRGVTNFRRPGGGDQNLTEGAQIWWGHLLHLGSPYIRSPPCTAKKTFFWDTLLRIRQVSIKFRITARQAGRDTSPPANGRPAAQDSGVWRHTTAERTVVCLVATRGLLRCPVGAIFRIPEILWFLYHYHSLRGILTEME